VQLYTSGSRDNNPAWVTDHPLILDVEPKTGDPAMVGVRFRLLRTHPLG
jgi:hypothetical protein